MNVETVRVTGSSTFDFETLVHDLVSSSPPQETSSDVDFLRYLGWTILLGIVFGVGLILGQRWVEREEVPPLVSVDASTDGARDAGTARERAFRDEHAPDASIDFSFYDRLSKGIVPPLSKHSGPARHSTPPAKRTERSSSDASSRRDRSTGERTGTEETSPNERDEPARYTLQVSAHRKRQHAESRMRTLEKKGLDPYLVEASIEDDEETYYRVRIGKFASMKRARAFQRAIARKRGVDASLMPL